MIIILIFIIYNKKCKFIKPVLLKHIILYINMKYLNKYGKEIPTTWDELIDTGMDILNEERKLNNTDLVGYCGYFPSYYLFYSLFFFYLSFFFFFFLKKNKFFFFFF